MGDRLSETPFTKTLKNNNEKLSKTLEMSHNVNTEICPFKLHFVVTFERSISLSC